MSINSEALQRKLYDLLDNKGYNPKPMDATGKVTPVPEEAAVIKFDFIKDGENYGKVWISIDGSKKLKIYYGDNVSSSPSDNTSGTPYSDSWTALINHLKNWAQRRQLSFELRNENHLEADMAQRDHMDKKERISEGYYPMGKTASYSDAVPSVKIVIEHSRKIEEGEQRFRNINRIFVENAAGERFLLNTTKPGIARVYARHIAEGGTPYDERGQHIKSLVEEYQKMAGFVRATKNGQFNESTQKLIAEGVNHYNSLRESLSRIASKRGYDMYFESWAPTLMEDDSDTSSLNELFVQETMDPRIESAMPILAKLSKNIREMAEVSELAEWADSLLEGGDGPEASEEKDGDTPGNAGEGGAEDADDDLMEAPGAETLAHNEKTEAGNLKAFDLEEGMLDGSGEIDSPVANAITRRILLQRTDLLAKYGPEKVADAIANIADDMSDWIGPDDEIGSSDVSGWVKRVESELAGEQVEEGRNTGDDIDDMVEDYLDWLEKNNMFNLGNTREQEKADILAALDDGSLHSSEIEYALQDELEEGLGDIAKKVGGAVKAGAKAVGKAIVGKDDDELLADLKKKAGVRNPQTGKPSMAHSDVEKVDEVDLGQYDAVKAPLKGKDTSDWDKNFREKLALYMKELDQRQKEKKEKSEKVDEDQFAGDYATGEAGQWRNKGPKANKPATIGDLVGENFINTDAQAVVTEEDPENIKEGQEDLDAILRIIKK